MPFYRALSAFGVEDARSLDQPMWRGVKDPWPQPVASRFDEALPEGLPQDRSFISIPDHFHLSTFGALFSDFGPNGSPVFAQAGSDPMELRLDVVAGDYRISRLLLPPIPTKSISSGVPL